MNLPLAPILEPPIRGRKNVLLIDARQVMGEMRATILRNRGVDVDLARQISAARVLWNRNRYDLVLFDFRQDANLVDQLVTEIKTANPHQKVAFFVGEPNFWSLSPVSRTKAHAVAAPVV
jgi:DNA-binding NtrC family response regulator